MDKENLIISVIIVLCIGAIAATYGITNNDNPVFSNLASLETSDAGNGNGNHSLSTNTSNSGSSSNSNNDYISENNAESDTSSSSSSSNSDNSGSSSGGYSNWQQDYETGTYDEDGNPIYRTVASTSGGQNNPGIYETYWSAGGQISEERIG